MKYMNIDFTNVSEMSAFGSRVSHVLLNGKSVWRDKKRLIMTSINGNKCRFNATGSPINNSLQYVNALGKVLEPFKSNPEISSFNSVIDVNDIDGQIHGVRSQAFYQCSNLSSVNISNVSSVNDYAFYQCSNLLSLNIPQDKKIGIAAFAFCSRLSSICCNSTIDIQQQAFTGCKSLSSIMIPSVSVIGNYVFYQCTRLSCIDFSERSAASIPILNNTNAFSGLPVNYKIIVPNELYDDWTSADNWQDISSHIVQSIS